MTDSSRCVDSWANLVGMSDHEDSRPPIDDVVVTTGRRWRVEVVAETTSTNAGVADRFREGEGDGLVLVAEHQTAGRGRLGREWVAPPRSSLIVSFLFTPEAPPERWPWLPLLTGVATADAVRRATGVEVGLKWPNDVLAEDGRKLGGSCSSGSSTRDRPLPSWASASTAPRPPPSSRCRRPPRWPW